MVDNKRSVACVTLLFVLRFLLPASVLASSGPEEPDTRTLASEEAQKLLEEDWLFQANGKPSARRVGQELVWAREMAARLQEKNTSLDLSKELAALSTLEKTLVPLREIEMDFAGACWIWDKRAGVTTGTWYFQKGFAFPAGQKPKKAKIIITCDNRWALYVNGQEVGQSESAEDSWVRPQIIDVSKHLATPGNAIAVKGVNDGGPAGLLVKMKVEFADGSSSEIKSDESWSSTTKPEKGWNKNGFTPGPSWQRVRSLGVYGVKPFGNLVIRPQQSEAESEIEDIYLRVRQAKRQIMFKDPLIDFSTLIFIDVPEGLPHQSMHRVYPQAQLNCGRLLVLEGLNPAGKIRKVTEKLGTGWYWRPDVSYDAKKILFCFRPKEDKTFHLYECNVDGSGLRQLTDSNYDDQDPVYLPDGKIAFVSNRGGSRARCTVGHPSTVVARCDADGKNIYLLSGGNEPEYTPSIMPDGRILYTRWEYTDKEIMRIQSLWTVNPDGTGASALWGNQSYWPDMLSEARPIPDSHRVMFAAHGHHEVFMGSIGIVDPRKGFNYPHGLTKVTQDVPWPEVGDGPDSERLRETSKYHILGDYRGYKSPYPLSEELFLVSARRDPREDKFKILLMDVYGNRELIYEAAFHALYAIPLRSRKKEPVIPDHREFAGAQKDKKEIKPGIFHSADIYQGTPEILRGQAKYLRVIQQDHWTMSLGKKMQDVNNSQYLPHMEQGPVISVVINDSVKFVLGYVPIEKDGSVNFEAPPCVALHFQLLDENHRALHTMRSFANLMPGETRGCVGCHEGQNTPPSNTSSVATSKKPAKIAPYRMGPKYSIGYERDIQPILDKHCGACHQGDENPEARNELDLTLRPAKETGPPEKTWLYPGVFPEPYLTLTLGKNWAFNGFPINCEGGIAGTILAEALPWTPDSYKTFPPMTALSYKSKLIEIASSGKHHEVQVNAAELERLILWVDTLCAYRGERELREMADPDPNHPLFKESHYPPSDVTITDVYKESPYRPRMRTAPLVNRAYRQDEFPTVESRLPRDEDGKIIPPVSFTPDGRRVEVETTN